jgi:phosphoenolpyruvate-protein kinase (PTS system EI component)
VPIIPAVKARVRALSMEQCRAIAREALEAESGSAVRAIVARHLGADKNSNGSTT